MAKKDKDKKKSAKQDKSGAADAVRAAVEGAFAATAGSTRGRAQELVDDITAMASRVREALEELRVVDDLRGLRTEVDALARRVAALEAAAAESRDGSAAPARASAGTKPAGTRSAAAKPSRAKATGRKPGATAAAKPARPRAAKPKAPPTETADTASGGRS